MATLLSDPEPAGFPVLDGDVDTFVDCDVDVWVAEDGKRLPVVETEVKELRLVVLWVIGLIQKSLV